MSKYFLLLALISALTVNSQTVMRIHQSNGTILQIPLNTIDSITYDVKEPDSLPSVKLILLDNISGIGATAKAYISKRGGTPISQRGICVSTRPNPTTSDVKELAESNTDTFEVNLTFLSPNTRYFVRLFAINGAGTAYGEEFSFTTLYGTNGNTQFNPNLTYGEIKDVEDNIYKTIQIGTQNWMAENLRVTKYRNGVSIPNIKDQNQWLKDSTGAWCHYNNNVSYDIPYGKLYNWYAATNNNNICPVGWRLPTDADWNILVKYLDPNADTTCTKCGQTAAMGNMMMSAATNYWGSTNFGGNVSGFSALPAGAAGGGFSGFAQNAMWWALEEGEIANTSFYRNLIFYEGAILRTFLNRIEGISIRCIKEND